MNRWKGCFFLCLLYWISLNSSDKVYNHDRIKQYGCVIYSVFDTFMQRCAFLRALMLSFIMQQNKCAVHIYSSPVWRCELWGFRILINWLFLFCIIFHFPKHQHVKSFRTVESLLACTLFVMWICLFQRGRKQIWILLRYKMLNNAGNVKSNLP